MTELFKRDMRQKLIGERIRKARIEAGLSQDELGRLYGVRGPSIVNIEKGRTKLDIGRLEVFAGILGKPVEWFLSDKSANVYRPPHAAILELDYWADAYLPLYDSPHGHGDQKLLGFVAMYQAPTKKESLRAYAIKGLERPPEVLDGDILVVDLRAEPQDGDMVMCETMEGTTLEEWPCDCRVHAVVLQQIRVRRPASS